MPESFKSDTVDHDPHTQPSLDAEPEIIDVPVDDAPVDRHADEREDGVSAAPPTTEPDDLGAAASATSTPSEAWSVPPTPPPPGAVPELVPAQAGALGGHGIKRWKFLLLLVAVWIPAAAAGLGLYYWWYESLYKTWPLFVLLVTVVACVVVGILLAMVADRPLISALAIAVMSAPFAALIAAAVLHGAFYFQWIERPG